jgi:chemotaxis signal transduction protein
MAISVECVAEILATDTLARLPWSPPQVVGMCSYHREAVPVVKLGPLPREDTHILPVGLERDVAIETARVQVASDERCVVLILKTEHGTWGIRVDSGNTTLSRESPEHHAPRTYANGPVLIGVVRIPAGCYEILDTEATWRGLRSAIAQWCGLISEANLTRPLHTDKAEILASRGAQKAHRDV